MHLTSLRSGQAKGQVPISNFVTREAANNIDTTQRVNGKPVEYIRAGVGPDVLADDKVKELRAWLETQQFDPVLNIEFRGADEEQQESQQFYTLLLSILYYGSPTCYSI